MFCISFSSFAQNKYPDPIPGERVYDFFHQISPEDASAIRQTLYQYEEKTGIEIAVVTLKDLGGEDEASYAQNLGNKWGVGEKGVDNGILLVVSFEDRTWRIHTGKKMEIYLTDYDANEIGTGVLIPALQAGNPSEGIKNTVDAIIKHIGWQSWPEREKARIEAEKATIQSLKDIGSWIVEFILAILASFFGWKFFKSLKFKREIRKELKQLDQTLPTIIDMPSNWPIWAKELYQSIKEEYEILINTYNTKKAIVLKFIDIKGAESDMRVVRNTHNNIGKVNSRIESIATDIFKYQNDANIQLSQADRDRIVLQTLIDTYKKQGFVVGNDTTKWEGNISHLHTLLLEDSNENAKNVFELSNQYIKEITNTQSNVKSTMESYKNLIINLPKTDSLIENVLSKKETYKQILTGFEQKYPVSVYQKLVTQFGSILNTIQKVKNDCFAKAVEYNNSKDFKKISLSQNKYNEGVRLLNDITVLYNTIQDTKTSQEQAQNNYPSQKSSVESAITKARSKSQDGDVETSTRSKISALSNELDSIIKTTSISLVDWVSVVNALKQLEGKAAELYKKAENEIDEAESARRRRRQAAAAAAASSSSSYSSSSSRSSGSFGGGGFSGGGAGGKW